MEGPRRRGRGEGSQEEGERGGGGFQEERERGGGGVPGGEGEKENEFCRR